MGTSYTTLSDIFKATYGEALDTQLSSPTSAPTNAIEEHLQLVDERTSWHTLADFFKRYESRLKHSNWSAPFYMTDGVIDALKRKSAD